jgi:predicted regulator of amino acid metabolism with ACT domain
MWNKVVEYFKGYPERLSVVKILIKNGFSVRDGKILCDKVVIPSMGISRSSGVDRRTVSQTVRMIENNLELKEIFMRIRPSGTSLRELARFLNLGVVEVTPIDAKIPGILAKSALILADKNISIRQAIVDDPELVPEPKLTLIAEDKIPGELISRFLKIQGISKVSVY